MVLTCPRCATTYTIDDALVATPGTPVRCTRCEHVFEANAPPAAAPRTVLFSELDAARAARPSVKCPACGREAQPSGDAAVEWSGLACGACGHVIQPPRPRHHVMFFGAAPPAPPTAPRPSREPIPLPLPVPVPVPSSAPTIPAELEGMYRFAAEHLDDDQALLALADALMELGDPRGHLIAFTLQEERQSDLMRKVKVNVIMRDHSAKWAPPGAHITHLYRGFPVELAWVGPSPPEHLAWLSARSIRVGFKELPARSVLDLPRPQLRRITGLNRALLRHVTEVAPPDLQVIEARVLPDELAQETAGALQRLPKLRHLTILTTEQQVDARLGEAHLRAFLGAARRPGLKAVRLSLPRLSFRELDRCLASAPDLDVGFLIPWENAFLGRSSALTVSPRRRTLLVPARGPLDYELNPIVAELETLLGEPLMVVREEAAR